MASSESEDATDRASHRTWTDERRVISSGPAFKHVPSDAAVLVLIEVEFLAPAEHALAPCGAPVDGTAIWVGVSRYWTLRR
jgi:hypothetical protein